MITYKKLYDAKNLNKDEIVLDIETTGLDSSIDHLVLLGMISYEEDKAYLTQYFAHDDSDETRLLAIYIDKIRDKRIITFNGDKFDIPFLNNRLDILGMSPVFPDTVDIYKSIKSKSQYFEFESMKLMDIEKFLGIERNDPSRYKVISKLTEDIKRRDRPWPIMVHNENDLVATEKLRNVEDFFKQKLSIDLDSYSIYLSYIWINNDIAQIKLLASKSLDEAYFTGPNYDLRVIADEIEINLQVLYGMFNASTRGHVAVNIFDIPNESETEVDANLLIIRENRLYNYKNILNLSKKIIENHL